MDAKQNGEQAAFARPISAIKPEQLADYSTAELGLTKREVFAMAAMQGQLAAGWDETMDGYAKDAVRMADALLAELAKGGA